MIPLVLPSSLITKFLNTGLLNISLKPLSLSTSSSLSVLKFSSLSCKGASELFNKGISIKLLHYEPNLNFEFYILNLKDY